VRDRNETAVGDCEMVEEGMMLVDGVWVYIVDLLEHLVPVIVIGSEG